MTTAASGVANPGHSYCETLIGVRLSDTLVYCVETAKLTIELFFMAGGPVILVFPRSHTKGAPKTVGVPKICDFQPISHYVSETMRDRAIVTVKR